MVTNDQSAVTAFLERRATHGGKSVRRIDTHTAIVFLTGSRALKLQRAVSFDYLDFSTLDRRRAACEAEVRVNQRTAPELYRGVIAVTREADGHLALDGAGTPVEWLVDMVRFDESGLLDRMATAGTLGLPLMRTLANAVADLHAKASPRYDHGGAEGLRWVVNGNADAFAGEDTPSLDHEQTGSLTTLARTEIDRLATLLDRRRDAGSVRECHGDLHLGNIVCLRDETNEDGRPVLFDAIQFNDDISCIDTLYDLAFLLMDLAHRTLPAHANAVFNEYITVTADRDDLSVLPLFLSCRAAVRAKTSLSAARVQSSRADADRLTRAAGEYLTLALDLLNPPPARLVVVGGLSGTGKSTLARHLAPGLGAVPGALVLRSDEVRKELCGIDRLTPLGQDGYRDAVTKRVYQTLIERATIALQHGRSVIVDAVFGKPQQRNAMAGVARAVEVSFTPIWLEAPADTLITRVETRHHDPSDASADVVRAQVAQPVGPLDWPTLDASHSAERVLAAAEDLISD